MTGGTKDERLLLCAMAYDGSADTLDGLSTERVFALVKGLGLRENFCVSSIRAAFGGWEVGKRVKLDRAGEVARRWGTGCPFAARNGYNIVNNNVHIGYVEGTTKLTNLRIWNTEIIQRLPSPGQQGRSLVLIHDMAEHHAVALHLNIGDVDVQPWALVFCVLLHVLLPRKGELSRALRTRLAAFCRTFRINLDFRPLLSRASLRWLAMIYIWLRLRRRLFPLHWPTLFSWRCEGVLRLEQSTDLLPFA